MSLLAYLIVKCDPKYPNTEGFIKHKPLVIPELEINKNNKSLISLYKQKKIIFSYH